MSYYLDINTNVSSSTFEDMVLALINHRVHGQTRLHYIVCVNYVAYSYLVAIGSEGQSAAMLENLEISRRRYCANAFAALDEMDLNSASDIPMLQALLSGVGYHNLPRVKPRLIRSLRRRCYHRTRATCVAAGGSTPMLVAYARVLVGGL